MGAIPAGGHAGDPPQSDRSKGVNGMVLNIDGLVAQEKPSVAVIPICRSTAWR